MVPECFLRPHWPDPGGRTNNPGAGSLIPNGTGLYHDLEGAALLNVGSGKAQNWPGQKLLPSKRCLSLRAATLPGSLCRCPWERRERCWRWPGNQSISARVSATHLKHNSTQSVHAGHLHARACCSKVGPPCFIVVLLHSLFGADNRSQAKKDVQWFLSDVKNAPGASA